MIIGSTIIFGNTIMDWGIALAIQLLAFFGLPIIKKLVIKRLGVLARRTKTDIDDFLNNLAERTKAYFFLAVAIYIGAQFLTLPEAASTFLKTAAIIVALVQIAYWGLGLIDFIVHRVVVKNGDDAVQKTTINALTIVAKIALWSIIILLILENITGIQVDSLIASLGISGIAVALAVQNILSDLFASLSIAIDKPFVIGDFIAIDDLSGTVEQIGLKSTRIRSLPGEQIVFSNADMLNSRIRNYKRMERRRINFSLGVTYQTPAEKLAVIPQMIAEIISAEKEATFDRCHFRQFGDSALIFDIVYYVETADFGTYMNIQQDINFAIFQRFEQEGIEFAYPTQTLFIEKT